MKEPTISVWFGGLVDDMRDASGQMYRRNRYYDPATGQFTQQDPIGIAGGLNTYGFGNGDPVTYADSYGLAADTSFTGEDGGAVARRYWNDLKGRAQGATASGNITVSAAGFVMLSIMNDVENSPDMYEISAFAFDPLLENFSPGGFETCSSAAYCKVEVNTRDASDRDSRLIVLAHEVTGALIDQRSGFRGKNHRSTYSAVAGENIARTIFGCPRRPSHDTQIPVCR